MVLYGLAGKSSEMGNGKTNPLKLPVDVAFWCAVQSAKQKGQPMAVTLKCPDCGHTARLRKTLRKPVRIAKAR